MLHSTKNEGRWEFNDSRCSENDRHLKQQRRQIKTQYSFSFFFEKGHFAFQLLLLTKINLLQN